MFCLFSWCGGDDATREEKKPLLVSSKKPTPKKTPAQRQQFGLNSPLAIPAASPFNSARRRLTYQSDSESVYSEVYSDTSGQVSGSEGEGSDPALAEHFKISL